MNLHDEMKVVVAHLDAEPGRIAARARAAGRRRRRTQGVGVLAAVAVLGGLAAVQVGDGGTRAVDPAGDTAGDTAVPTPTTDSAPSPAAPAAGGHLAASALRGAIEEVSAGRFSDFRGQDVGDELYAELTFAPSDGLGAGTVGVNVQPGSILDGERFDCTVWMVDCSVRTLPSGGRLRTYRDADTASGGQRWVAERLTLDRSLRVVAAALNGFDLPANEFDVRREAPVLTTQQLVAVVTQDVWSLPMPAGSTADVPGYTELPGH